MLSALDIAEITNLFGRYTQSLDHGEAEAWADCFTEDGVFLRPRANAAVGVGASHAVGRAAIAGVARNAHLEGKALRRRWTGNTHISPGPSAEEAFARSSLLVFLVSEGSQPVAPALAGSGTYFDRLRKTADGWRIAVRALILDGGTPDPELERVLGSFRFNQ